MFLAIEWAIGCQIRVGIYETVGRTGINFDRRFLRVNLIKLVFFKFHKIRHFFLSCCQYSWPEYEPLIVRIKSIVTKRMDRRVVNFARASFRKIWKIRYCFVLFCKLPFF